VNFAWYYFDLHSTDGYDLILTWHIQPFQTVFPITIFDLFVYREGRKLLHKFTALPAGKLHRDEQESQISAPGLNFKKESGQYLIEADQPEFRLKFRLKRNPSSEVKQFELLPVPGESSFNWRLFEMLQPAECELETNGQKYRFSGPGYHDYNAGNINLKKELNRWSWLKLFYPDRILVLGEIEDRQQKRRQVAVSSAGGTINQFQEDEDRLLISSSDGLEAIQLAAPVGLDMVRFYMSATARVWLPWQKLREVSAVLTANRKPLSVLHRSLTNVEYRRFRQQATDSRGREISIFREEIRF